ncbi:hypothetical protein MMC11_009029, partial [Xylographa trunciseda]|nr:hypothetical protein [Xylographa trunciseda]
MADVAWNGLSAPSIKRRRIGDRDQQSDYCDHCTLMLSPNGLTELNSEEGFKHYDKSGCR